MSQSTNHRLKQNSIYSILERAKKRESIQSPASNQNGLMNYHRLSDKTRIWNATWGELKKTAMQPNYLVNSSFVSTLDFNSILYLIIVLISRSISSMNKTGRRSRSALRPRRLKETWMNFRPNYRTKTTTPPTVTTIKSTSPAFLNRKPITRREVTERMNGRVLHQCRSWQVHSQWTI